MQTREQAQPETFSFQAETAQILDLMVRTLYSNKEIFLRELISNASDAIDRLRLERFSQPGMEDGEDGEPPQIRVGYDQAAGTLTVSDNGIGMSRAEVIEHIGTIAKSGTREFLLALTGDQRKDANLIGQFGVGFYSAFVVAERVILTTRRAGLSAAEGVRWESDGRGEYTLQTAERADPGTTIVLHLREGEDDLLADGRLRLIIQKYSDHISLPILLRGENQAAGADEAPPPGEKAVNQASALWARPKSELSQQDYHDFYRHITGDHADPLAYVHARMEGTYDYTLLLFIPSHAGYGLWAQVPGQGVKLHVRRVLIMEDSGQVLPQYLRFVCGVIDSSDLPLNISREMLQQSRVVSHIRATAVKKVLKLLSDMATREPAKYAIFWREFGAALKEGIAEDYANRDDIAALLRFDSSAARAPGAGVSLSDYVARMKQGQDKIYYLLAPTPAAASTSPHLEAFRKKGIEVLLLGEAVDNWVIASLREFQGVRLQSVSQGAVDFGTEDEAQKKATDKAATEFAALLGRLKAVLADEAWDVRVSGRLTRSPACIVANEPDNDASLAYRMAGSGLPGEPVLEINPQHPLVDRLNRAPDDPHLEDWAHVLYNEAVLTLGARIEDPADFVDRLNALLVGLTSGTADRPGTEHSHKDGRPGNPAGRGLDARQLYHMLPRS
jgi:molecular chaperone HtpG